MYWPYMDPLPSPGWGTRSRLAGDDSWRLRSPAARGRLDELEPLLGDRRERAVFGAGRQAAAGELHGRIGEADAILVEGLLDHGERPTARHELHVARLRHHLHAQLHGVVAEGLH